MPLFSLPQKVMNPHLEVNEDGVQSIHAGYAVAKCRLCPEMYIIARIAMRFDTCSKCEDKQETEEAKV